MADTKKGSGAVKLIALLAVVIVGAAVGSLIYDRIKTAIEKRKAFQATKAAITNDTI